MKFKFLLHFLQGSAKRSTLYLYTIFFFFLSAYSLTAEAQQIHTIVDVDSVRVGDTINLSVVLEGNYTLQDYPDAEAFPEDLELLNLQRFQTAANRDSIVYSLQYFGVEDLVIDPLQFNITASQRDTILFSNRVPFFFKTTLASQEEELKPLKPIFDFARSFWPYIIGGILLILLGFAIMRYLKERAKQDSFIPQAFRETAFVNPLDELEEDIVSLQSGSAPANREEFEKFYVRLADAIRRYLKRVYGFSALEMTTGEIITALQRQRASADLIRDVKKVLRDADMVKFAKFNPASDQVSDAVQTGVDFIETARTVDSDRVEYLEYQHKEEQETLRQEHHEEQQKLKQEFDQ